MRVRIPKLALVSNALGIFLLLLLSACSTNSYQLDAVNKKVANKNKPLLSTAKKSNLKLQHSHASNPCTNAISHIHLFESSDHKHSYNCENTNKFISNAHVHPATNKHRRHRHVHPNGTSKHDHH